MCWSASELAGWHREKAATAEGDDKAYHERAAAKFGQMGRQHIYDRRSVEEEARAEVAGGLTGFPVGEAAKSPA